MKIKSLNLNFDGVIFDMDGLLVNSEYLYWQANIQAAKEYKLNIPSDSYLELIGASNEAMNAFYKKYFNASPKQFIDRTNELVWNWSNEGKLKLQPGVKEILDYFEENNIRMAIASSNSREVIEHNLTQLDCRKYFDFYLSEQDIKEHQLKFKPAPDIYLLAQKEIEISKNKLLIFEDSSTGAEAAKSANINCIMISDLVEPTAKGKESSLAIFKSFLEFKKKFFDFT